MRTLFVFGLIATAAFLAGWFTISRDDEHTTIRFNRDEIRNDARGAIDRGREILNKKIQGQPGDGTELVNQSEFPNQPQQYQPEYPERYSPSPYQPAGYQQPTSYQPDQPSHHQAPQQWPTNRNTANPQTGWSQSEFNNQHSAYPSTEPNRAAPTQWQPPPRYPAQTYPAPTQSRSTQNRSTQNEYLVPRQY